MKLSTHNKLAMLYRAFYNKEQLPKDLCSYFWLTLIALILTPFVWPALVINKLVAPFKWKDVPTWIDDTAVPHYTRSYRSSIPVLLGLVFNAALFIIGIPVTKLFFGDMVSYMSVYKWYLNGIAGVFIFAVIITLFVKLMTYLANRNPKSEEQEELEWQLKSEKKRLKRIKYQQSFRYLLWQRIKAWKEDNCPILTWEDDK